MLITSKCVDEIIDNKFASIARMLPCNRSKALSCADESCGRSGAMIPQVGQQSQSRSVGPCHSCCRRTHLRFVLCMRFSSAATNRCRSSFHIACCCRRYAVGVAQAGLRGACLRVPARWWMRATGGGAQTNGTCAREVGVMGGTLCFALLCFALLCVCVSPRARAYCVCCSLPPGYRACS